MILGELAALGTALCWGVNSMFFTAAGKKVGSDTVAHLRLWLALFFLIIIHLFQQNSVFPWSISADRFTILAISGVIGFVLGDIFLFRSYLILGTSRALVVKTLAPSIAALLSWIFLAETLKFTQIIAMLVTSLGIIIVLFVRQKEVKQINTNNYNIKVTGIIFALIGAVSQSVGMILSRIGLVGGFSALSATLVRILAGTVAMFALTFVRSKIASDVKSIKDKKSFLFIVLGSILGPVIGVWLSLYAIQHTKVGVAATLIELSPIVVMTCSSIILKKRFHYLEWIGSGVAIAGAALLFV